MLKKLQFSTVLAALLLVTSIAFAAFPVKKEATKEVKIEQKVDVLKESIENLETPEFKEAKKLVAKPAAKKAMDEEQLITLALWFFLGGLAAHRWYAGKSAGSNILFILTAGGCGIWAIVDLINILTGDF